MRRVLKFVIPPAQILDVWTGSLSTPRVLLVDWQDADLCIWIEATEGHTMLTRFGAVMTGDYVPADADHEHVGSAQGQPDGERIVAHVYRWTG